MFQVSHRSRLWAESYVAHMWFNSCHPWCQHKDDACLIPDVFCMTKLHQDSFKSLVLVSTHVLCMFYILKPLSLNQGDSHNPDCHPVGKSFHEVCLNLLNTIHIHLSLTKFIVPEFLASTQRPFTGAPPSFPLSIYLLTIPSLLISKPCQHNAGLSRDERQWWWLSEFINRSISLKVNQRWAIRLSESKLSELCSTAKERCFRDVYGGSGEARGLGL